MSENNLFKNRISAFITLKKKKKESPKNAEEND